MVGTFESLKFSNTNFWTTPMHYECDFPYAWRLVLQSANRLYRRKVPDPSWWDLYMKMICGIPMLVLKTIQCRKWVKSSMFLWVLIPTLKRKAISGITETRYIDAKSVITWKSGRSCQSFLILIRKTEFSIHLNWKDITIEPDYTAWSLPSLQPHWSDEE